jgi:type III restriction enzyme
MTDSKLSDKKEGTSDDIDAYDLIMKNKELLLDRDPKKSPVRFIFSHSALREGWDNPNVFQICTLKQSSSEVRKRQEVGRGLRLCVNQDGERMDANVLGNDVQSINVLTVIASESYDSFAKGLQTELADAVAGRPVAITADLFKGKVIVDARGNEQVVDGDTAQAIYFDLIVNGYIDKKGVLTDKYYADKANGTIQVAEEVADSRDSVINILDSVYDSRAMQPENARDKNVELQVDLISSPCRSSRPFGNASARNQYMWLILTPMNLLTRRLHPSTEISMCQRSTSRLKLAQWMRSSQRTRFLTEVHSRSQSHLLMTAASKSVPTAV